MAMVKMSGVIMVDVLVVGLVSVVSAITGTTTFYTPPSSCNGYQDDGVIIAAASDVIWNNKAACGRVSLIEFFVASSCNGFQDDGVMIVAASDVIWNNKHVAGCYQVKCTGPTNQGVPQPCRGNGVTVKIVDYVHQNVQEPYLSQESFTMIADPNAGKVTSNITRYKVFEDWEGCVTSSRGIPLYVKLYYYKLIYITYQYGVK